MNTIIIYNQWGASPLKPIKMKYKVTIYPVTPWTIRVEAKNEEAAKKKALNMDGPDYYAYREDDEWYHDISEWPNIGKNGEVYIEEDE